jgi:uncharacterized membrane protein YciS (DUF1049 family)
MNNRPITPYRNHNGDEQMRHEFESAVANSWFVVVGAAAVIFALGFFFGWYYGSH